MVRAKIEKISSLNNPKVKLWYHLKSKKGREETGLYLIEGYKLVEEAVLFKKIESLIIEEGTDIPERIFHDEKNRDFPIIEVSAGIIKKLSDTKAPQGIIAIIKKETGNVDDLIAKNNSFLLIDEIQDPGNFGTIIRSADAAGIGVIILGKGSVELHNPKVIRASMGSVFHLPVVEADLQEILIKLKEKGIYIIGTSPYAEKKYFEIDLKKPVAVLVGNEANGLAGDRINSVDDMVSIPLIGNAESLNVATATTLILYERVRQLYFL